jgi:hypothetical protein
MNITKEGDSIHKINVLESFNKIWKDNPRWVELYNNYKPEATKLAVIIDNEEAKNLLEECLYLLNEIPNKKYKPKSYKDSYELASVISKYLKK